MLKYLALAASLAVASCGAAPAYAAECPQGTLTVNEAIENLLKADDSYEVIGVFPVPLTEGSEVMLSQDGNLVYSVLVIDGCVAPLSARVEGVYVEEKEI